MVQTTLSDGRMVTVRAATSTDAEQLEQLFYRLSSASVMLWLCAGVPQTPHFAQTLVHYADCDGSDTVSLVAEAGGCVVGIARYVRVTPESEAEIAVVIEDSWQGRHMGRALLRHLALHAATQQVRLFVGDCMGENVRALRMLAAVFPQRHAALAYGTWHIRMPLSDMLMSEVYHDC